MEEDNSMCERILGDIQNIIYTDVDLKEFCIVPISENKNKSPVLYEEHNLGLESWCVKYVYRYIYSELFKIRRLLNKNRLPQHKLQKLNKFLIGALLIHPDVSTFWNMRRELLECGEISLDRELLLTQLVLSHKSKSNEAFTYRKWILNKCIKKILSNEIYFATSLLMKEFFVTEMASNKSQNNYHSWSHRIWCLENIGLRKPLVDSPEYLNIILNQLHFSFHWINKHISEHAGFHYRQYLCNNILNNTLRSYTHHVKYYWKIIPMLGCQLSVCKNNGLFLNNLLGERDSGLDENNPQELLKRFNYYLYIIVLLHDLIQFIWQLNETFPGHESVWYHRRFVVYHLIKIAYDYHGLTWKRNIKLNDIFTKNVSDDNITFDNEINIQKNSILQENGEKCPKLIKYEFDKIESSNLYKMITNSETKFIRENCSEKCSDLQKNLAIRHEKWLRFILCLREV